MAGNQQLDACTRFMQNKQQQQLLQQQQLFLQQQKQQVQQSVVSATDHREYDDGGMNEYIQESLEIAHTLREQARQHEQQQQQNSLVVSDASSLRV